MASLGLSREELVTAKIGVIMGSFCSTVVGMIVLTAFSKKQG